MLPCVEGPHLIVHLYVGGCLCHFRVLASTNVLLSMPTCVYVSMRTYIFTSWAGLMLRSRIAGSCGDCLFEDLPENGFPW